MWEKKVLTPNKTTQKKKDARERKITIAPLAIGNIRSSNQPNEGRNRQRAHRNSRPLPT